MFIDSVSFFISSGNGGKGCVSFFRAKFITNGGPDGGDGGKGGDVLFEVSANTNTLAWYKGRKILGAKNGADGKGAKKKGKSGQDLKLKVPPGTQVINDDTNEVLFDLVKEGDSQILFTGGKGGLGNVHFKNSRNQAPRYAQSGISGVGGNIRLELKLIADIGLVGFPNVGKSTLISTISNSKAEVANYEFTTLTPNLGVVNLDNFNSFTIADIPGLIEGASDGKGLGITFLKHYN